MNTSSTVAQYHPLLRVLHWTIAALIIVMLFVGFVVLGGMDNTDDKKPILIAHMVIGMTIGVLMVVRIVTRLVTRKPPPASAGNMVLNGLRRFVHFLFYVVVLSMISTGVGLALIANLFPILFGAGGDLPPDFHAFPPLTGHEAFAVALMALILLHVIGVLYHQLKLKDRLLARMGWGRSDASNAPVKP